MLIFALEGPNKLIFTKKSVKISLNHNFFHSVPWHRGGHGPCWSPLAPPPILYFWNKIFKVSKAHLIPCWANTTTSMVRSTELVTGKAIMIQSRWAIDFEGESRCPVNHQPTLAAAVAASLYAVNFGSRSIKFIALSVRHSSISTSPRLCSHSLFRRQRADRVQNSSLNQTADEPGAIACG
jgi:hypothetical protein